MLKNNVTSTVSLNSDDKSIKYKMDCFILHTFLLVIILSFMLAIITRKIGQNKNTLLH